MANETRKRPGRPRTRPGDNRIEAYFSDAEIAAIRTAANRAGLPVSHWIREVCNKAARSPNRQ